MESVSASAARVVEQGRRYAVDNVITIVDRPEFKKWTVVADEMWRAVELTPEGWKCTCPSPVMMCPHVVAAGLSWLVHRKMVAKVEDIDDKALLEAVRQLTARREA